jgi:hypothetical protein
MAFNSTSKKFNSKLYIEQMGKLAARMTGEKEEPSRSR